MRNNSKKRSFSVRFPSSSSKDENHEALSTYEDEIVLADLIWQSDFGKSGLQKETNLKFNNITGVLKSREANKLDWTATIYLGL